MRLSPSLPWDAWLGQPGEVCYLRTKGSLGREGSCRNTSGCEPGSKILKNSLGIKGWENGTSRGPARTYRNVERKMRNAPITPAISLPSRSLLIHTSISLPQPLFTFSLSQFIFLFVHLSPYLYSFPTYPSTHLSGCIYPLSSHP